jgi:hypothetical protein
VLLAAFAVALTDHSSCPRAALHLVVSNRFRPGFAGSFSPVMQSCLAVIEVAGAPFEEVVRRAWQAALSAYKHAYFDPAGQRELCDRLAAERRGEPDWSVVFNDRRVLSRELPGAVSDAGDDAPGGPAPLRDELTATKLTWGERNDLPAQKVFLSVVDMPGTLGLELWADTHFVTPADMAGLLRRIESVLIDGAGTEDETVTVATTGTVQ